MTARRLPTPVIKSVQMLADGGFQITLNDKVAEKTEYTVELQERVSGEYKTVSTKTVTIAKDSNSVTDNGNKFVLEAGKVYKVVVNGVESNEIKGA